MYVLGQYKCWEGAVAVSVPVNISLYMIYDRRHIVQLISSHPTFLKLIDNRACRIIHFDNKERRMEEKEKNVDKIHIPNRLATQEFLV